MILSVIRELASKHTTVELAQAAELYELKQENPYQVAGKDEGEILTNLLMAVVVRTKMDSGLSLQDAIREHSKSIQSILAKPKT